MKTGIVSKNIGNSGWIIGGYQFITHEDVFTKQEFKGSLANGKDNKLSAIYIDINSSKFEFIKSGLKAITSKDNRIGYDSNTDWRKEIENQYITMINRIRYSG
ncbi:hypothetical protein AB8U03_17600 [Clostridium sp. Mt-5]|uniref:Uncharacterized protein n=1 Tax=Clostridium moutaii TaxID=3240932 RepID=A0ABV4BT52_9CLOT